jgi:alpha-tubulin suppressor-like RCC1 family protein
VYSWGGGGDDSPELGRGNDSNDGYDDNPFISQVITALLGKRVRTIAAGLWSSCAVTDAGALYTWGLNESGNLGHGDDLKRARPEFITALQGIREVGVSIFSMHGLALAADGRAYSFGKGPGLGIRHGDEQATRSPQRIPDLVCLVPR